MLEDKKESPLNGENNEEQDFALFGKIEKPAFETEKEEDNGSSDEKDKVPEKEKPAVKVVRRKTNPKEEEKKKKQKLRKQKKEARDKKYPSKLSFFLGLIILIFAFIGVVLIAWNSIRYIRSTTSPESEYAQYNAYLAPIVAVDPDPFDDITRADTQQLLDAAIWAILDADSTPDTYSYSGGYMLIPAADVGNSYVSLFGPETVSAIEHQTIQGYNCTFEYDSASQMYRIPVTTIQPIYTPQVKDVEKSGSSLVITVSYLSSESWMQDSEGNYITPQPDKVMKITLRELMGSYYISAIQTVSSTIPEIVSFEISTTAPHSNEPQSENEGSSETLTEATTKAEPEKTTLGGRV